MRARYRGATDGQLGSNKSFEFMATQRGGPILSIEVQRLISEVADRARAGVSLGSDLEAVITALSLLPAGAREQVEAEVRLCGRLSPYYSVPVIRPGQEWLRSLVSKKPEDAERTLSRTPRLAHLYVFHGSGYARQAALNAWNGPPDSPLFLAAIAGRLNDWVPEVRTAAKRCAERWFPRASPEGVAGAFEHLIERQDVLGRWSRDESQLVEDMLYRKDVLEIVADQLLLRLSGPAQRTLRYALRRPGLDAALPRLAVDAALPDVRAVALKTLIDQRATWISRFEMQWVDKRYGSARRVPVTAERDVGHDIDIQQLLRSFAGDRATLVRKTVASALIDRLDNALSSDFEIARQLAHDKSPAVASKALYFLEHATRADAPESAG